MLTRRTFLKLIGIAAAASAVVPALVLGRAPYVLPGEVVDFIGHRPAGGRTAFTGARVVREVLPWDGVGYPVLVDNGAFGKYHALEKFYDADLAAMLREVPARFWSMPESAGYPNVHTWIRRQRFGESMEEAIAQLNFVMAGKPC